jgi:uncharacterized membrane protein YciS (DUF1049 family)
LFLFVLAVKDSDSLSTLHKVLIGSGCAVVFFVSLALLVCCLFRIRQRKKKKTAKLQERRRELTAKDVSHKKTPAVILSFSNSSYAADPKNDE